MIQHELKCIHFKVIERTAHPSFFLRRSSHNNYRRYDKSSYNFRSLFRLVGHCYVRGEMLALKSFKNAYL